jgi:PPK2 family polyphosphate:nucleotide phosphotransferase
MSWASKLSKPYLIKDGKHFKLKDYDPADVCDKSLSKDEGITLLNKSIEHMSELQSKLYAQDRWALLLIFQAMDAAGKDGAISHVMSGVNPQGCQVYSFKQPSSEELDHDFLWRTTRCLPERGRIGIFNRSYYEEVLVVKVHPEILAKERMPEPLVRKDIWKQRYQDIHGFERYLSRNGVVVRKFFLNVSKKVQKERFLDRLEQPDKNWKYSSADVKEREHWDEYMKAYEELIQNTATEESPWYVVPADHKWFTRLVVAAAIVEALEGLKLAYPEVDAEKRKELEAAKQLLLGNKKKEKK